MDTEQRCVRLLNELASPLEKLSTLLGLVEVFR